MKKFIKQAGAVLTIGALLAGVTGCGSQAAPANGSTAKSSGSGSSASSGGEIKIGLMADMTGPAALSGKEKLNGAQLAVDEINAAGGINGKKLKLVTEDDQGTNQGGVASFQKLVSDPSIVAVVGSIRSTIVQATDTYVKKTQIPVMIGGTNPGLTHAGDKWVFRARPNDNYSSKALASYITQDLKGKKVAILHDTDAFGSAGGKLLDQDLKQMGATVVSDQGYTTATKDYTAYLENIKKSGADVLGTYMTNSEDAAQMIRQLRQLGLNIKVAGSPSIIDQVTIKLAKQQLEGVYGVADFVTNGNDAAKKFTAAYKAKYGNNPDNYSSYPYDAINILANAMKKVGTDPNKLRQAILDTQHYQGAEGEYNFDKNGDGLHSYTVVEIKGGKVVPIKTVSFTN
ncbi:ABC transporter substrate-binding protein [Fodinisporobacter ferrooxydans]|uniref:ABC transporter substrate-binding protein n=1 Tax=Fodinisporobacter ferrooxydans TaxID=2901836 RepID=A0ABY4CPN2_9BACL|nr:ABC transporter substrate-binding protein [Alicyclobacillaceae bacterium MYW30-H2]